MPNIPYGAPPRYMPGLSPEGDTDVAVAGSSTTLTNTTRRVFATSHASGSLTLTFVDAIDMDGVTLTIRTTGTWTSTRKLRYKDGANGTTTDVVNGNAAGTFVFYCDGYGWIQTK